jgi:hypothetical protein
MSCGGSFAVRRQVLLETPIDHRLKWAEIEDGDWSERLIAAGKIISYAPTAQLATRSDWKNGTKRWNNLKLQRAFLNIRSDIRRLVFKAAQLMIDKLAKREDLFAKQGCFSKRIKRVFAAELAGLKSFKWESLDGIYVQGDFETRENLREPLLEIFAHVPVGKSVTLELASAGFPYLFRSEHIRNCESLCYEASLVFRDDFYVRQLICTKQRNFIVEYVRTHKATPTPPDSVYVYRLNKDSTTIPLELKAIELETLEQLPARDELGSSAVLLIGGAPSCSFDSLVKAYNEYGGAWSGKTKDLFWGTLLAPATLIKDCLKHPGVSDRGFQLSSLEKQLILDGFWPKLCLDTVDEKK